jgi:hypothetical protein
MTRTCRKICIPPLDKINVPGHCTADMDVLEKNTAYPVAYEAYRPVLLLDGLDQFT